MVAVSLTGGCWIAPRIHVNFSATPGDNLAHVTIERSERRSGCIRPTRQPQMTSDEERSSPQSGPDSVTFGP